MEPNEVQRRLKAMQQELGLSGDQLAALAADVQQSEKDAQQQGIAFKEAAPEELTINGVVYTVKAAVPPMIEEAPVEEEKAPEDMPMEEAMPEEDDGGPYVGDMTPEEFSALLSAAFAQAMAPLMGVLDIEKKMAAHVDSVMGGYKTKDDTRAQEIATLKDQQADIATRLLALEGDQPAVTMPADMEAALKSEGPKTPAELDPSAVNVPDDPSRPWAGWAAQTFPELYQRPKV